MKKVFGLTIVGGLKTNGLTVQVNLNNRKKYAKYEVTVGNCVIARTDNEEKARMYVDALEKGYDFGISPKREKK